MKVRWSSIVGSRMFICSTLAWFELSDDVVIIDDAVESTI